MPAVDADTLALVTSVTSRTPPAKMQLTRRNVRRLSYQFYRGASAIQLAEDSTGQLLLKSKANPAGPSLARALTWTREGSGVNAVYWFELSLLTDEVEELFEVEGEAIEPIIITGLILELNFIEAGRPQTPIRMDVEILNRYLQEDEGGTTPADPDMPLAADILVRTAQTLSAPQKAQVLTNLGLSAALCRDAVAGPVTFGTSGSAGQYWFDEATARLWVYVGGQFRYSTLISEA